jgi:5-dehydro-2-deoxygluconokinase
MHTALPEPVYMMAIDHRWQWAEWCDKHRVDHARVPEVKRLAADAFLLSRQESIHVKESGVLLVDLTYGAEALARARAGGATIGTPAERAGAFPLEWTDTFERSLPGTFAKVLVRHNAHVPQDTFDAQHERLLELQNWCGTNGKPLVLEVLVSGPDDPSFERVGRPRLIADYIRSAYARGIAPQYWKIEGVPDSAAMQVIDEAIGARNGPRQLILGKGAGLKAVAMWFNSARGAASAAGFAIGRTVYWQPAGDFLLGKVSGDAAVRQMAANYQTVVDLWRRCAGSSLSGARR